MGPSDRMDDMTAEARALNAAGAQMRRLWAEGIAGTAVITTVSDTGERLAGNVVVELGLVVTVDGSEPYTTVLRMPIGGSDLSPYASGRRYAVKVDPRDPHTLTFAG